MSNPIRRLVWLTKGAAARVIEREYEDTLDAILYPIVSGMLLVGGVGGVQASLGAGTLLGDVSAFILSVVTLLFLYMAVTSTLASIWYYREQTAEPLATEVTP